eukprot:8858199-Ditylum_brightwellii.AAC.1
MSGSATSMFITGTISPIRVLIGSTSLAAVGSAILLWSLKNHVMGQLPYMITQPDLDETLFESGTHMNIILNVWPCISYK